MYSRVPSMSLTLLLLSESFSLQHTYPEQNFSFVVLNGLTLLLVFPKSVASYNIIFFFSAFIVALKWQLPQDCQTSSDFVQWKLQFLLKKKIHHLRHFYSSKFVKKSQFPVSFWKFNFVNILWHFLTVHNGENDSHKSQALALGVRSQSWKLNNL